MEAGVQEYRSTGVQEFRSSGVQEFRSSRVQECRSAGASQGAESRENFRSNWRKADLAVAESSGVRASCGLSEGIEVAELQKWKRMNHHPRTDEQASFCSSCPSAS